jgi:hypothetical protein
MMPSDALIYFVFLSPVQVVTVRLAFLPHSVCMRPTFQGLLLFECDGLGEDELLLRSGLNDDLDELL